MNDTTALTEREKFEAWAEKAGELLWGRLKNQRNKSGGYSLQVYTHMWNAWQAANVEMVEALEKAQTERDEFRNRLRLERSILEDADKRIAELESEVKFPGVMRCNTCGFSRSHVIVTPGGMRAGESTPEHCPNGCGPMWHDTYRRQYNELYDAYKALESRTVTVKLTDYRATYTEPFALEIEHHVRKALKDVADAAGIQVIEGEGK